MKKKKIEEHNPVRKRRVELLSKYYPLDEERRAFKVQLYYPKAGDMLYEDVSELHAPRVKDEVLERISDILSNIPNGYGVDLELAVDDFEGYQPEALLEGVNDVLELNHYHYAKETQKKWFSATILVAIGIILFFNGASRINAWWGDNEVINSLVSEVMNIAAWVFIWEAVSVLFLSPSEYRTMGLRFLGKVNSVKILKDGGKNALACESKEDLFEMWEEESHLRKIGRYLMLFAGGALIAIGFAGFTATIGEIIRGEYEARFIPGVIAFASLYAILQVYAGVGGLSRYVGRGKLYKSSFYAALVLIPCVALDFVLMFQLGFTAAHIARPIFTSIVAFSYILGFIFSNRLGRKSPKK